VGLPELLARLLDRAHCSQGLAQRGLGSRGVPFYFPGLRSSYRMGVMEGSLIVSSAPDFMRGGMGAAATYKGKDVNQSARRKFCPCRKAWQRQVIPASCCTSY
jgi:hypothetical protein